MQQHSANKTIVPLMLWQVYLLVFLAGLFWQQSPWLSALAAGLVCWLEPRVHQPVRALFACVVLVFAVYCAAVSVPQPAPYTPSWLVDAPLRVEGRVDTVKGLADGRLRVYLKQLAPSEGGQALPGTVVWTWEQPSVRPLAGQRLQATLRLRPTRAFMNADGAQRLASQWRQEVWFTAWSRGGKAAVKLEGEGLWHESLREQVRSKVYHLLYNPPGNAGTLPQDTPQQQAKGMALALLFGDLGGLSSLSLERVTIAGLRHSLALSGQHLAVVALLALGPFMLVWLFVPRLFLHIPRRLLLGLFSLPFAVLCLWLGAAPLSLVRAALMLGVWLLIEWRRKSYTLLDSLFSACAALLAFDVQLAFDAGVQLSVLAVLGIALGLPLVRHVCALLPPRAGFLTSVGRKALTLCGVSLSAQAGTLPVVLSLFGRSAPWFASNLLWLPLLGLVVLPSLWLGVGALSLGFEAFARLAFLVALAPCEWLLVALEWLDTAGWLRNSWTLRPHPLAALGYAALMLAALVVWSNRVVSLFSRRLALAGALCVLAAFALQGWNSVRPQLSLTLMDVGQGQSAVLAWPGGRAVLDGGGLASRYLDTGRDILAPYLTRNAPPRLDFVFASHMDHDHLGGLVFLLDAFTVSRFYHGKEALQQQRVAVERVRDVLQAHPAIQAKTLAAGDSLVLHPAMGIRLETVWPKPGVPLRGNDSVVLRLMLGKRPLALVPGDLGAEGQLALLQSGMDIRAEVLLLPHHGSARDLVPELYDAVKPRLALVSTGAGNRFGFPSPQALEALRQRHIPLFDTGQQGALRLVWNRKGQVRLENMAGEVLLGVEGALPPQTPPKGG